MSGKQRSFAEYPQQVQFGVESAQRVYLQKPGYYAVHYAQPETATSEDAETSPRVIDETAAAEAIAVMEEESIAVFSGSPSGRRNPSDAVISPVYALQPGGSAAVPTGMVFVRFAENTSAVSHQDAISAAGYEIVEQPPYTPHAVWLRAQSGNIADSLQNLPQLMAIPDVENVEPQMLMQRSLR